MQESELTELGSVRRIFRALAMTIVPEAAGLDEQGWADLERIVDDNLRSRPHEIRTQLRLLMRVLQWLPVLRWGRPFTSLPRETRYRFLSAIQDAPILLLRRGFWGLRTFVFMGYYGRPEAAAEIGYDARLRGRQAKGPIAGEGRGELL